MPSAASWLRLSAGRKRRRSPVETTASIHKDHPRPRRRPVAPAMATLPMTIGPASLRQAALRGDPAAQLEVASRFAAGQGVERDLLQAFHWYGRAAAQGSAVAQYRFGALYERGLGTARGSRTRARVVHPRGRAGQRQGHAQSGRLECERRTFGLFRSCEMVRAGGRFRAHRQPGESGHSLSERSWGPQGPDTGLQMADACRPRRRPGSGRPCRTGQGPAQPMPTCKRPTPMSRPGVRVCRTPAANATTAAARTRHPVHRWSSPATTAAARRCGRAAGRRRSLRGLEAV